MSDDSAHAMHAMEGHHMDMGPHMKMTALRAPQAGDTARADKVVDAARIAAAKYRDYHTALNDGYEIFLPNVPQKMYHFTKKGFAFESAFHFNLSTQRRFSMKSTATTTSSSASCTPLPSDLQKTN
jgi:hypothetical protein